MNSYIDNSNESGQDESGMKFYKRHETEWKGFKQKEGVNMKRYTAYGKCFVEVKSF